MQQPSPPSVNAEINSNADEASSPQSGEVSLAPNTEAKENKRATNASGEANSGLSEDGDLVPLAAQLATPASPADDRDLTDEELKKFLNFGVSGDLTADLFKQGDGSYQIGAPLPGGKAVGQVPAGLEAYYGQRFTGWKKCEDLIDPTSYGTSMFATGECGYLITPIDYNNPAAGNIALFVYKHAAESGKSKGAIVFNNGGPGGEAARYVASWMYDDNPTWKALRKDYDLVGMDPRGVGHSFPFSQCVNSWSFKFDGEASSEDVAEETEKSVAETRKYVKRCFSYTGRAFGFDQAKRELFLKNVGTTNAARDMDVLRSVLGQKKLTYVGLSYGTRLGYVYAQNFPNNVGRFILDGALNPYESTAPTAEEQTSQLTDEQLREQNAHLLSQGKEFQATFEKFTTWCKELKGDKTWGELYKEANYEIGPLGDFGVGELKDRPDTCALELPDYQPHDGDLADDNPQLSLATRQVQNLLRPLVTKPLSVGDPSNPEGTLGYSDATVVARGGLYSQSDWPKLARVLFDISQGNKTGAINHSASEFEDLRSNYSSQPFSRSAFNAINCADSANPNSASTDNGRKIQAMYYQNAPFVDPGSPYNQISGIGVCEAWPFAGTLAAGSEIKNLPNILVVGTTNDPATAYKNTPVLAQAVFGTMLSVEGAQHIAFGKTEPGYECANKIMLNYLMSGKVPADGKYPPLCTVQSFRPVADNPSEGKDKPGTEGKKPSTGKNHTAGQQPQTGKVAGTTTTGKLSHTGTDGLSLLAAAAALILAGAGVLGVGITRRREARNSAD